MAKMTERVRFTISADKKKRLRVRAAVLNISMSELVRRIMSDAMAWHDLEVFCAELELKRPETTIQ